MNPNQSYGSGPNGNGNGNQFNSNGNGNATFNPFNGQNIDLRRSIELHTIQLRERIRGYAQQQQQDMQHNLNQTMVDMSQDIYHRTMDRENNPNWHPNNNSRLLTDFMNMKVYVTQQMELPI